MNRYVLDLPYVRCAFYHFYEDLKSEKLSGTPIL